MDGTRSVERCDHSYITWSKGPFPDTEAMRTCVFCDYAEVQLASTKRWLSMEQYSRTEKRSSARAC